ncbi:protein LIKE EARLY STARVATION, chloroplastic [Tasmannia lanceolata]|uniref:protein LIKE EARLY STARVATION, chloroplastic n=1 Tax=Tasmannia lanceolata TaxID=3420 RepID=UPI004062A06F
MEAPHFITSLQTNLHTPLFPPSKTLLLFSPKQWTRRPRNSILIRVSSNGDSYLDMWKKAVDRDRKTQEFEKIVGNVEEESAETLERMTDEFMKILEVPKEERDRIQRLQVIDRAAAAIAAAQALLKENPSAKTLGSSGFEFAKEEKDGGIQPGALGGNSFISQSPTSEQKTPGPDFWSWSPPVDNNRSSEDVNNLKKSGQPTLYPNPSNSVMEKEQSIDFLSIPFESTLFESHDPPLPPLQSIMEVDRVDISNLPSSEGERKLDVLFSRHAAKAVDALHKGGEVSLDGVYEDGSKWWKETGIERRPNGVVCKWTLTRGVSADGGVEWEEKYWEAADQFDFKELGSEKSGRDAAGNVWREFWKETMWQDLRSGLVHIEKTADKWGKSGKGDEWQEKWWEHYDASGYAEKWAHKWCSIDPNTPLEAGHAHVWHERWGEKYDGQGSSIKYTDKWAERSEGDAWTKWGDKWDENFDSNGHGVKQGETWWEGKHGERWNRTWGEHHNGSGWVHKYGKSSCGEHWDTHVEQETWYERYPHYGFELSFKNSVQLRDVHILPEIS